MHKKKPFNISTQAALSKVQFICSKQEKCCSDIRKKLQDWNISVEDQDEIINSLMEDKFIDESRYTNFYVQDKCRFNKWGKIKISHHLKHKHIPEGIIHEALEQINQDEYQKNLRDLLQRKLESLRHDDRYQLKTKLYRFAQSRGFESQLSLNLIDDLLSKSE
ncbi:regulatory protein RecX [Marinifilum sp.]|uniref:regulatory protein RecX n=1 Tax=Marinifilum sp. TaxID=2033137 RepID=UPI003BAD3A09